MKRFLYFILCIALMAACQSIEEVERPENYLAPKIMEDVLFDVAVMNAARGYNIQKLKLNGIEPDRFIYEKYNIDSLQYAQNTVYYAQNETNFRAMHERVQQRIEKLHDSLEVILEKERAREDSIRKLQIDERRQPAEKQRIFKLDSVDLNSGKRKKFNEALVPSDG